MFYRIVCTCLILVVGSSRSYADIIAYWDGFAQWQSLIGEYTTVGFTGHPTFTVITDQYASEGIHFTNPVVIIQDDEGFSDGAGLTGTNGIRIHFDTPHHAVGVDFFGAVAFALYLNGELIGAAPLNDEEPSGIGIFGAPLGGIFVGILSDIAFDEVYLFKPQPPFSNNIIGIDNLYWGAPIPAPGALGLFALTALGRTRRKR